MNRLFLALPVLMLLGCATVATRSEGNKIDKAQVLNLKPGVTTRQMVLETFGPPANITFDNNEEKMMYIFKEKKTPSYLNGLIESEAQSKESTTTLEVILRSDVVYSYRYKSSEN